MKTPSKKSYHIVRCVGNQGTHPPRELSQLGVEKCTTSSASSLDSTLNGHQERDDPPNPSPTEKTQPKIKQKEKRIRWTREDYTDVTYAFYMSLEKPSGNHTENTYNIWRARHPDVRPNMNGNKLANVRRDILNKKRLLDVELNDIKERVKEEIRREVTVNVPQKPPIENAIYQDILDDIPVDNVSDDVDFNLERMNNVRYDDDAFGMNNEKSVYVRRNERSDDDKADPPSENLYHLSEDFARNCFMY